MFKPFASLDTLKYYLNNYYQRKPFILFKLEIFVSIVIYRFLIKNNYTADPLVSDQDL